MYYRTKFDPSISKGMTVYICTYGLRILSPGFLRLGQGAQNQQASPVSKMLSTLKISQKPVRNFWLAPLRTHMNHKRVACFPLLLW